MTVESNSFRLIKVLNMCSAKIISSRPKISGLVEVKPIWRYDGNEVGCLVNSDELEKQSLFKATT